MKLKLKTAGAFLASLAYLGAMGVLLAGLFGSFRMAHGDWLAIGLLALLSIAVIGGLLAFSNLVSKMTAKSYLILLSVMILLSVIASAVVLLSVVAKNIGWDPGVLFDLANHAEWSSASERYLTRYSNNIFIALVIVVITEMANLISVDPFALAAIINSALLFTASIMIMYMANRWFGRQGVVVAWFLSFFMITLSPWIATFYSDTVGLFFVVLIIVLVMKFHDDGRRYIWATLLGICSAVGLLVKPTVIVFIIAMVLSLLVVVMVRKVDMKSYLKPTVIAVLLFILTVGGFTIFVKNRIVDNNDIIEAVQLSSDHFLAMGSLRGLPPYTACKTGGYCNELIHDLNSRKDLATREARKVYHAELLRNSIMTDFPAGYIGFAYSKVALSFGDGSFLVWREGSSKPEYFFHGDTMEFLRQYLGQNGRHFQISRYVWQAVWIAMIVLIMIVLASELRKGLKHKKVSLWVLGFAITITGLACYQILFESRSRYIFLYLPVFILLATGGVSILLKFISATRSRKGIKER